MASEPRGIEFHVGVQPDYHDIAVFPVSRECASGLNRIEILATVNDPLREQETRRQLIIVTRSTHRDRDALLDRLPLVFEPEPDLQGLFDCEQVVARPTLVSLYPLDARRFGCRFRHH